jgi:hypothetical protein
MLPDLCSRQNVQMSLELSGRSKSSPPNAPRSGEVGRFRDLPLPGGFAAKIGVGGGIEPGPGGGPGLLSGLASRRARSPLRHWCGLLSIRDDVLIRFLWRGLDG